MDVSEEMLAWTRRHGGECEGCGRLLEFCDCSDREQWTEPGADDDRSAEEWAA